MKRSLLRGRIVDLATVLCLAGGLAVAARPSGIIGRTWREYDERRNRLTAAAQLWPRMQQIGLKLYPGDSEATIFEFSDYQCPYCRASSASVDSATLSGIRVAYLHMPLRIHRFAMHAAAAATCAKQRGRFAEVHARLMTSEAWLETGDVLTEAAAAGVTDTAEFRRCLDAPETAALVSTHAALADSLRVRGTPTFIAQGASHGGLVTASQLRLLATGQRTQ